ncbi:MAG: TIR domain-containing protein, partial [Gammaproteobacteria bacterium]
MSNSFFVCYAREDYEYVASFQVELQNQINEQSKNLRELLKIELKIDQTPGTINLGEKYKDKIENIIENSTGAILFLSKNFSNSQFINEIEIPKILEKKKIDSDYLILPIFIDAAKNINKEILTYQ